MTTTTKIDLLRDHSKNSINFISIPRRRSGYQRSSGGYNRESTRDSYQRRDNKRLRSEVEEEDDDNRNNRDDDENRRKRQRRFGTQDQSNRDEDENMD